MRLQTDMGFETHSRAVCSSGKKVQIHIFFNVELGAVNTFSEGKYLVVSCIKVPIA